MGQPTVSIPVYIRQQIELQKEALEARVAELERRLAELEKHAWPN